MTFTGNYCNTKPETLVPVWSLSVEEPSCIVWPFVMAFLTPRGVKALCGLMVAAAVAFRLQALHHAADGRPMWGLATSHLHPFAWGTLLALHYDRLPRLSRPFGTALVILGVAGLVVVTRCYPPRPTLAMGLAFTAVPVLCTGTVAVALAAPGIFLAHPRLASMDKFTCRLYLWHAFPLTLLRPKNLVETLGCLLVSFALAFAGYHLVERPLLGLRHRFERNATPLAAQTA